MRLIVTEVPADNPLHAVAEAVPDEPGFIVTLPVPVHKHPAPADPRLTSFTATDPVLKMFKTSVVVVPVITASPWTFTEVPDEDLPRVEKTNA